MTTPEARTEARRLRDRRDAQIRTRFEALRAKFGGPTPSRRVDAAARREACDHLALDFDLSTETIRQIVAGHTTRTA